jgi:conjugal transfer pilus assembly protein TraV
MKARISLIMFFMLLWGCQTLPYEEEFICERGADNIGKCVTVEEAYEEALKGRVDAGAADKPSVNKKGRRRHTGKNKKLRTANKSSSSTTRPSKEGLPDEQIAYQNYRTELYQQLQRLMAEPETPVVKNAEQTRTLILSYSPEQRPQRLYMPRFVYSIKQGAEFVMGQYRLQDSGLTSFSDFINKDKNQAVPDD